MQTDFEDEFNEDFFLSSKLEKSSKDELLDKNFQKAKNYNQKNSNGKKSSRKKPFLKSGIFLIILSIICIAIIILNAPWGYVKSETDDEPNVESYIYRNDQPEDIGSDNESQKIINIFETDNCSSSSCNFIGLSFDDFSSTPKIMLYGFIILAILGLLFVVFQIIDKIREFSHITFYIIHSVFSAIILIIGVLLLIHLMKFLSVYFLFVYNDSFISTDNVLFISPVGIVLFFIIIAIIKTSFSIMKINYNELCKKINITKTKNPFFIYKGGSKAK